MPAGSLTVVGTGIRLSQLSVEARAHIQSADKLLFLVADPVTHQWLLNANRTAESLSPFYSPEKLRRASYEGMVARILACVSERLDVCAAFYGHPGVFANPSHEAIRRARLAGYRAEMLPAVSAEDCLFADLGIDPGRSGCQSFEATEFLISRRRFDPRVPLILWQPALTGDLGYKAAYGRDGLRILVEVLLESYAPTHEVVIYEAAQLPGFDPAITWLALATVPEAAINALSTLYIPPGAPSIPDAQMLARLGIPPSNVRASEVVAK
jgi:uncharacterized protein YabN with tetrapyrrole methylase and pyrophosphatase domain